MIIFKINFQHSEFLSKRYYLLLVLHDLKSNIKMAIKFEKQKNFAYTTTYLHNTIFMFSNIIFIQNNVILTL